MTTVALSDEGFTLQIPVVTLAGVPGAGRDRGCARRDPAGPPRVAARTCWRRWRTSSPRRRGLRPDGCLRCARMPSLITFEEALELGELNEHEDIERLVELAWQVRQDNFGESTDMCSLVNAKSGGCAEDCGFCAQSKFADAETPMHAMMEPEQILEHAKAAEAAGAHRFCMVTQGQGLSKRDFEKVLEGARLVAEHTNLKRCASIGHMSAERAKQLKEAGIQRVHHNVETARSYYDEVSTTVRYEGRMRTIEAVREAGLETCVGGILNLGETPRQRIEMAFELAELDPTSVPINLLNPRAGTKFGDRDLIDPWDAVKFIAIFRLILPAALFRLCGGRVENLGELQPLAVKAGLNGVMMGNFLTTLGSEPEEDRAMFEELGLNVARQPDNGANPRPGQPLGLARGRRPRRRRSRSSSTARPRRTSGTRRRSFACARRASRPPTRSGPPEDDRAGRRERRRLGRLTDRPGRPRMSEIGRHLDELRERGLYRRMRMVAGPQGPRVMLDGRRVLLLCSNNYLGFADHPRVREAAAERRDALRRRRGRVAPRLGQHDAPPAARGAARRLRADRALRAVRLRLPRQHGRDRRARARGRRRLLRRAQPREHHRRLPARARRDLRLRPPRHRAPRVGPARGATAAAA